MSTAGCLYIGFLVLDRTPLLHPQACESPLMSPGYGIGIQAQTAECLVLGELATDTLLVALNKVDLLPAVSRDKLDAKARKRLAQTFAMTKFAGCTMVTVAAKPGARRRGPGARVTGIGLEYKP